MSLSSQKLNRRTVLGATTLGAAAAMMPVVGTSAAEARIQGSLPGEKEQPVNDEQQPILDEDIEFDPEHAAWTFLRQKEFFVAHRGSGDINPEHTAYAYTQTARNADAIEISLRTTADNIPVCIHDESLMRVTGLNRKVRDLTLQKLRGVYVNMRKTLGEGTPLEQIPTFEEAVDAINNAPTGKRLPLFIEAKDWRAQGHLLKAIKERGLAHRVVIKMYRDGHGGFNPNSKYLAQAKAAGCQTWCYFDANDSLEGIRQLAGSNNVDALGVPYFESVRGPGYGSMADDKVRAIVGFGKPVIVWEVHRRSTYEHYKSLGVRGFMSPDPSWVCGWKKQATINVESGRREHGMLPSSITNAQDYPDFTRGAIVHQQNYDESLLLGPLAAATDREQYTLEFAMHWDKKLPTTTWNYGYMAFGRSHDGPLGIAGKFRGASEDGCYVLALRPGAKVRDEHGKYRTGDLAQLIRLDGGPGASREGKVLHTMSLKKPIKPNESIEGKIVVKGKYFYFVINGQYSAQIHDAAYRGPYVHFGRYHGNATGGPLVLTRALARESWA